DSIFLLFQTWHNSKFIATSLSLLDVLPAKGLLYMCLLMMLNRMAVFVVPSIFFLFNEINIFRTISACWGIKFTFSVLAACVGSTQKFNRQTLKYENIGEPLFEEETVKTVLEQFNYALPLSMFVIYVIIYCSIRKKRKGVR
ncbi:hypothetical protein PMAYCL1PPCAC_14951, partial [Pristionchus mayeri]